MESIRLSAPTLRRLSRAALPIVGLSLIFAAFLWNFAKVFPWEDPKGVLVRIVFACVMPFRMEYITRLMHRDAWHSKSLWCIHATHHHQKAPFGTRPTIGAFRNKQKRSKQERPGDDVSPKADETSSAMGVLQDQTKTKNDAVSSHTQHESVALKTKPGISVWEDNDLFPIVFACLSVPIFWVTTLKPNTLARDCMFGLALGITIYGMSYFFGHDLVCHQRAGPGVANALRNMFPYMGECADVHRLHHQIEAAVLKKDDPNGILLSDDDDPHGPPYGFWLGPFEVKHYNNWRDQRRAEVLLAQQEGREIADEKYEPPPVPARMVWAGRVMLGMTIASFLW